MPPSIATPAAALPERIGPFTIHGVLGRGGMGVVFDARTEDGDEVALKVVRPVGDQERAQLLIARFLREAKILEQLDHPGVVRLVASGASEDGLLYLAMERIEGVSLLTIRRRGALELMPLVELGVYLSDALAHMHAAGVVHRDIKPANILIGAGGRPVITDFGISGLNDATGITRHGDLLGSPGFMAPEVVEGDTTSPASDQFALGRLMFELGALGPARKLPKNAPILEVLAAAMEIDWERFRTDGEWPKLKERLDRMLAKKPSDRYESSEVVTAVLRELLPGSDVLDIETLSEHLEKMDLEVSRSWEILADDLELPDEPADELIRNLDLPAGDRFVDDFEDPTQIPAKGAPPLWAAAPSEALPAFPADAVNAVDRIDRHDQVTIPPPPMDETRPPLGPRPSLPFPGARPDVRPAVPLETLTAANRAADTVAPESSDQQTVRLERQLVRMRDELSVVRRTHSDLRASRVRWRVMVVGALAVGLVAGLLARPKADPRPSLILMPPAATAMGPTKFQTDPARKITERDRTDAAGMLEAARERLAKRDLDGAQRLLGLCIEVADLPACHKTLATMLTLTGEHESARAHYEHYLDTAPADPDAARIRALLRE